MGILKKKKLKIKLKFKTRKPLRDRAKRTKKWDHKGYKSQLRNIFKNSKFYKKKSKWPS